MLPTLKNWQIYVQGFIMPIHVKRQTFDSQTNNLQIHTHILDDTTEYTHTHTHNINWLPIDSYIPINTDYIRNTITQRINPTPLRHSIRYRGRRLHTLMIQVARGAYFGTHHRRIYNNWTYIIKQVAIYSEMLVILALLFKLDNVATRWEF